MHRQGEPGVPLATGTRASRHYCATQLIWLVLCSACASSPTATPRDLANANDTGRKLAARSADDRALLAELSSLPQGAPKHLGHETVVADAIYAAASGRSCRVLHLTQEPGSSTVQRLACSDGHEWFWVPNVFADAGAE